MLSFLKMPLAEAAVNMTAFGQVINPIISKIVYPIIELMFGVSIVVFVYGVLQLVLHGNDEKARERGQTTILYGSIGLFIMVSAWGIIYLVSNTVKEFN